MSLTGENSFGLSEELNRLTRDFLGANSDLALQRIDAEEADFTSIREALTSLPFLSDKKLVVLRSPSKQKEFVENFEQLLDEIPETTDVIIVEPKPDKRLTYYKTLKSKTQLEEFKPLDAAGLANWLVQTAKAEEGQLSSGDARYLVERVGQDQQLLSSELDKLLLYDKHVTRQTIDLLTEPNPQSTIFELLDAAFAGRQEQAMKLYNEQKALKVEPAQIIAMLAWQLNAMAIIKTAGDRSSDDIAREAKLNPFVVRKSLGLTRQISYQDLKQKVSGLLDIDTRSKRTELDVDEALQNYLLSLAT